MSKNINRRSFVKKTAAAMFAFTYLPNLYGRVAASDRVRVAHIGINGMGTAHLKWFANLPEVETVALCDLDSQHLSKAKNELLKIHPNSKADTYDDFRKVLERKDIDAISCATPDHWHAQVAMMAFESGKDVYGEKPLSYTVKEGQAMLESQIKHNKIFQLGTQIHAGDNYHRVVELIQGGAIGKVHTVRLWKSGEPPVFDKLSIQAPPSNLNWDFWQGPTAEREYAPERCHFNYRYFMDYSGGVFQDFWCHIADVVWWSINPHNLKSIEARGEKSLGVGDTPRWIDIDYKFKDLDLYWTTNAPKVPGADGKSIGAYFEGEKGTLLCDYSSRELRINGVIMNDIDSIPKSIVRSPGHQQNFIDSVKSRTQPESNLAYARQMVMPMHLGLLSWRLGRKLKWNFKKEKFKSDKDANALLSRANRKAYDWA